MSAQGDILNYLKFWNCERAGVWKVARSAVEMGLSSTGEWTLICRRCVSLPYEETLTYGTRKEYLVDLYTDLATN